MSFEQQPKTHRIYWALFVVFLKHLNAETAHHLGAFVISVCGLPGIKRIVHRFTTPRSISRVDVAGLDFETPFGIAAGFDKNAKLVNGLYALGFGHVEVGTITAQEQPGNPRPRLFRLVADRALINRMGFNNDGAHRAARRLAKIYPKTCRPIIGVNIGKTKIVDIKDATQDYLLSAQLLAPYADYLAVNVSSPNTPGLRSLQDADTLEPLLAAVKEIADCQPGRKVPVFVKIAPDLSDADIVSICQLITRMKLAGIIATNTTISRTSLLSPADAVATAGEGGLSGRPLVSRAKEVLKIIRKNVPDSLCVISVGGVETGADVAERMRLGANLVQGYTAFLYQGPLWARGINKFLAITQR